MQLPPALPLIAATVMSGVVRFLADHGLHVVVGGLLIWFVWKAVRLFVRPADGSSEDVGHDPTSRPAGGREQGTGEGVLR